MLLWALAVGCGPTPAPQDAGLADRPGLDGGPDASGPLLELGSGQLAWEPLRPSGNRLELIHGPQGGYHVFGRVRFRGLGPDVYVSFRVTPSGGGPAINDPASRVRLRDTRGLVRIGDDAYETSGAQLVILEAIRGPMDVVGRDFRLEMTVQRFESTQTISATAEITIVDKT
ncbi:MAG: hypothetical protein U0325_35450 [Polyangiales bacterium]